MIGVIADVVDQPVVREFFELFKTPWEFFQDEASYDVLLCANSEPIPTSAKLILVYASQELAFDKKQGIGARMQTASRVVACESGRMPLYGASASFRTNATQALVDEQSKAPVSQTIESSDQTFIRIGYDLFAEIRHLLTCGQPADYASIPALELHIDFLRNLIVQRGIPLVEIPPVPEGHSFIACLTHDVDHVGIRNHKFDRTLLGFLYRALPGSLLKLCRGRMSFRQLADNWLAAFKLPFVHLGLAKDFWYQFDHYLQLEQGVNSTFFIVPYKRQPGLDRKGRKPSARATRYDISDIPDEIGKLVQAEREIGLHGLDAWLNSTQGTAERRRIAEATGAQKLGVRMHWLCFDEQSYAALEAAGFHYDSTVGYNQCIGYRAGTGQVFRPLGVTNLLELPLHIMDTAMFYPKYMDLSPGMAEKSMAELIDNAVRFGGMLTINWHDRSIAPERLWDNVYTRLLNDLKSKGAWFPTASQAVSWFALRRSAVFGNPNWECESSAAGSPDSRFNDSTIQRPHTLPGLRLRCYNGAAPSGAGMTQAQSQSPGMFVDVPFNHASERALALTN
jgi:peptidoglycan/xylan/chitin deacetylase (PgdA/CDA1 family)